MITQDKITDIFCVLDEFSKKFDAEAAKVELISSTGGRHRRPCAARRAVCHHPPHELRRHRPSRVAGILHPARGGRQNQAARPLPAESVTGAKRRFVLIL